MAVDSALGWIGDLARYFGSWFPHPLKILATHRGVKFVRGRHVRVLEPGFYWYIPALTEVYIFPVVEQTDDLPVQSGCTLDHRPVAIGGLICFTILDIRKALVECFEIAHIIRDRSVAVFNEFVSEHTFADILAGNIELPPGIDQEEIVPGEDLDSARARVNAALTLRVRRCLRGYGVHVVRAQLTHFGPCYTLVHVGRERTAVLPSSDGTQEDKDGFVSY